MSEKTTGPDAMSAEEKRHDQLTTAPKAVESDAAPRIEISEHDGVKRIDIAETAAVRPGADPDRTRSAPTEG